METAAKTEGPYEYDAKGRIIVESTKNLTVARCPSCGHLHRSYRVQFSRLHLRLARIVFEHCVTHGVHEFRLAEIKGLKHTDYTNLSFLQRFGLIYFLKDAEGRKIRSHWGVPLRRLAQFLRGEWAVAKWTRRDVDARENENAEERIFLHQIPKGENVLNRETMLPVFLEFDRLDSIGLIP